MGQRVSFDETPSPTENIQDDLLRQVRIISEIAVLSYEEFVQYLGDLNKLSRKNLDSNGRQLIFAVKKGTDSTILWRGTVKIGCIKINPTNSIVESYRLINLAEFLQIFKTLRGHMICMEESQKNTQSYSEASSSRQEAGDNSNTFLTASMLMKHVDDISSGKAVLEKSSECCICLERKPEVILPCAHSYCLPCIERWNVNNKTCPICRERLDTTDDTWIISEAPDVDEISAEICSSLNKLSELSPQHRGNT